MYSEQKYRNRMRIYIAHSSNFDFRTELYIPIKESTLGTEHTFLLPHDASDALFSSRELFANGCDLVIAEVSFPSTGMGIELGWANAAGVPIVCVYKSGTTPSSALASVTDTKLEYANATELLEQISKAIQKHHT